MRIDIWSDVVCPWCYIGKRRLEIALKSFAHRDEVEVVYHSFELDPSAPAQVSEPDVERLSRKYGVSLEEARAMNDRVTALGAAEGLDMRLDHAHSGNTFDAHRLLHLARDHGLQPALIDRLFRAYFTEGRHLAEHETLVELAVDAGLDADPVRRILSSDEYSDVVRADEAQARVFGITGVPFFVVDGRYGIAGAQSSGTLAEALRQAWSDRDPGAVA